MELERGCRPAVDQRRLDYRRTVVARVDQLVRGRVGCLQRTLRQFLCQLSPQHEQWLWCDRRVDLRWACFRRVPYLCPGLEWLGYSILYPGRKTSCGWTRHLHVSHHARRGAGIPGHRAEFVLLRKLYRGESVEPGHSHYRGCVQ